MKNRPRNIVITGASSGIGEALALHYAAPGITLLLTGRNEARLEDTACRCRAAGAQVTAQKLDVTNRSAMKEWLEHVDSKTPVDLVIANAGISAGTGGYGLESGEQIRNLFETNVTGVFNTIDPLLPRMTARGQGHIALMSSLAGFRGWPGAPAYCATKAAVKVYGEGLRGALKNRGIKVHVIMPGFVQSRMTAVNSFSMPFIISAEKAAAIIARGIEKDKGRIAFPFPAHALTWLLSACPDPWAQWLLRKAPGKQQNALENSNLDYTKNHVVTEVSIDKAAYKNRQ